MDQPDTGRLILAITYTDSDAAAEMMRRLARKLAAAHMRCCGFIQRGRPSTSPGSRCAMVLESLATGCELDISEDRGAFARGCKLDVDVLSAAIASAREAIQDQPDVLLINKFGKTEAEGGGFRPVIADAIERGIPILIAVPWRNIESWRIFAGDFASEIAAEAVENGDMASILAPIGLSLTGESETTDTGRPAAGR